MSCGGIRKVLGKNWPLDSCGRQNNGQLVYFCIPRDTSSFDHSRGRVMPKKSPKKSPSEIPSFPGLEPWPTASQAMVLENVGRTCFYGRLIRGEYEAYKD